MQIACFCHTKGHYAPNFVEKKFAYSHKTVKFVKVFSLESFPLYGNLVMYTMLLDNNNHTICAAWVLSKLHACTTMTLVDLRVCSTASEG